MVPFSFESHEIRAININGEPWFVAADICAVLTLVNPSQALSKLDGDECQVVDFSTLINMEGVTNQSLNPGQKINIINESGLYSLILTSRKPEAKKFKKWVTAEVLPAIRKTGTYTLNAPPANPDLETAMRYAKQGAQLARAMGFAKNMIALSANNLARKVTGVDVLEYLGATHLVADERGRTYTPTELGKMCEPPVSGLKFNRLLEETGLQSNKDGYWIPTDAAGKLFEWLDTGKRHSNGTPVKQIKWFPMVLDKISAKKERLQ